ADHHRMYEIDGIGRAAEKSGWPANPQLSLQLQPGCAENDRRTAQSKEAAARDGNIKAGVGIHGPSETGKTRQSYAQEGQGCSGRSVPDGISGRNAQGELKVVWRSDDAHDAVAKAEKCRRRAKNKPAKRNP